MFGHQNSDDSAKSAPAGPAGLTLPSQHETATITPTGVPAPAQPVHSTPGAPPAAPVTPVNPHPAASPLPAPAAAAPAPPSPVAPVAPPAPSAPNVGVPAPAPAPSPSPVTPTGPSAPARPADLLELKQSALHDLSPLIGVLEQSPEEKFRTTMMMIQASDDQTLLPTALGAAKQIADEKVRAQALLDVVNEINYFTQQQQADA